MRIVLIGAVEEGWIIFNELLRRAEYVKDIVALITLDEENPSNISGYRSFDQLAAQYGKPIYKIKHIRSQESFDLIEQLKPDLIMVMGWSQLVSDEVLRIPPLGCIGLHTTLLPRHRGRAPIPWAIIKCLGKSGNTLFYFTPGVDNGEIIGQAHFYITLEDTAATVYEKATQAGIDLVLEYLPLIKEGKAPKTLQDERLADHWPKRRPKDGMIDWNQSALHVHNLIRAVSHPYPGAFTFYEGRKYFIWSSSLLGNEELDLIIQPGKILDEARYENGLIVGTGNGAILVRSMQCEGDEERKAIEYLRSRSLAVCGSFSNIA